MDAAVMRLFDLLMVVNDHGGVLLHEAALKQAN